MVLIAKIRSSNKKKPSCLELYRQNESVRILIRDGRKVDRSLLFTNKTYSSFFGQLIENTNVEILHRDTGPKRKVELLDSILQNTSRKQILDNSAELKRFLKYNFRKDVEITSEMVLQIIWENFGKEEFLARNFKKVYESIYGRKDAYVWLYRLKNRGQLNSTPIEHKDGRINKKYSLSRSSLNEVEKFGSFVSKRHPTYWRKK